MRTFSYTAIETTSGRERSGTIEGENAELAIAALKTRGLAPVFLRTGASVGGSGSIDTSARPLTDSLWGKSTSKKSGGRLGRDFVIGRVIGTKALAVFTRQLSALLKAGMPLLRAIEVLARQERNRVFRAILDEIASAIRSGGNLSEALSAHPRVFHRLYVNMVKAGEASGALEVVLARLAGFLEKSETVKGKIKSAMVYPIIVLLLASGIVAGLMVFVVPKFERIFAELLKGQPLPALTRAVLGVSAFVQEHLLLSVGLIIAGGVAWRVLGKTKPGVRGMDWLRLRVPVVGDLFLKAGVARFTRTCGTLLASGVSILEALVVARDTSGNVHLAGAIDLVHERVKEGDSVARPLASGGVFPPMVASMVEVGEETGALPEMLGRVADVYDEEVDHAVAALTSIIEPLLIVFLAVVVGTIVIALFLPIVSVVQHLQ